MGNTLAFVVSDQVVGSVRDLGTYPTLRLEAIVAHAKHLTSEGLSHDRLAGLPSDLSQDACAIGPAGAVTNGVGCVRLLVWDLRVEAVGGDSILKVHRAVVHVCRVLLKSSVHWLVIQTGWPLERSTASAVLVRHVGSVGVRILLLT